MFTINVYAINVYDLLTKRTKWKTLEVEYLVTRVKLSWRRFRDADDYAAHAWKQKEWDIYGLLDVREHFFALTLTSKLDLFDRKTRELLQKIVAKVTYANFTESIVTTSD